MKPLISVIVPVYNASKYIERCINSILNQSEKNIEILLIDDGSQDDSYEVCERLLSRDNRIRLFRKENGGAGSTRNYGISRSEGSFIGFVDADDWIEENMYEYLLNILNEKNADIACCSIEYYSQKRRYRQSYSNVEVCEFSSKEAVKEFLMCKTISSGVVDKLFKKQIFDNLRFREGITHEDNWMIIRCMSLSHKTVYSNKCLYHCYLSPNSVSRKEFSERRFDRIVVWKDNIKFLEKNYPDIVNMGYANLLRAYLDLYVESSIDKKYISEKNKIRNELDTMIKGSEIPINGSTKKRLLLYKINPYLYCYIMLIYNRIKRL